MRQGVIQDGAGRLARNGGQQSCRCHSGCDRRDTISRLATMVYGLQWCSRRARPCPAYKCSRRGCWTNKANPKRSTDLVRAAAAALSPVTPGVAAVRTPTAPASADAIGCDAAAAAAMSPATNGWVAASSTPAAPVSSVALDMAAALPVGPCDSRSRLRRALLVRHSSLAAEIGEPAAFHVMGACLAVAAKAPPDARVEPLSVWASAVLRIRWALCHYVAAPTHLWRCSEPSTAVESAMHIVMHWVGSCSMGLSGRCQLHRQ